MSWRDVPMPPAVAALPQDRRGFPVPWVSEWSEKREDEIATRVVSAPHLGVLQVPSVDCTHVIGEGVPNLGALCPRSQIDGMLDRLCDVCGEFIPPGPIYFLGGTSLADKTKGAFRELGLHYECALYSAQVCPGMVTAASRVAVFECLAYQPLPLFIYGVKGPVGQPLPEEAMFDSFAHAVAYISNNTDGRAVLTGVHAALIDPKITELSDWVAKQGALRG